MNSKIEFDLNSKKIELSYKGNLELLQRRKVSIVGTRHPSQYSKEMTNKISSKFASKNIMIVSGGAIGVDAIAHKGATTSHTICVLPSGLENLYPAINHNLLSDIGSNGLLLSQFNDNFKATNWSFVMRNEIVVALGDILIVTGADLKSGSMTSVEFALKQKKEIFVLPHRIGESEGTNYLLKQNLAKAIYDIDNFVAEFCGYDVKDENDDFLKFCKQNPNYEDIIKFDSAKLFEYEILGKIKVENNRVIVL